MGSVGTKLTKLLFVVALAELIVGGNGNSGSLSYTFSSDAVEALSYFVVAAVALVGMLAFIGRDKQMLFVLGAAVTLVGGFFAGSLGSLQSDLWDNMAIALFAGWALFEMGGYLVSILEGIDDKARGAADAVKGGIKAINDLLGVEKPAT